MMPMLLLLPERQVSTDPTPQGVPVANPPTKKELHDWSLSFEALSDRLRAAEQALASAEASTTAALAVVAEARQTVADVHDVLGLYSIGAENWSEATPR